MQSEPESAGTFWQRTPDENFIKNTGAPVFEINCGGCKGNAVLDPFFCYSSQLGMTVSSIFSLRILTIFYGPYCTDVNKDLLISWTRYAMRLGHDMSATSIKIIPPFYLYDQNPELKSIFDSVFEELGFELNKMHTAVLDTTQSKDAIFKKLKYETRRSVRRVSETGIVVEKLSSQDHVDQWQGIKCRTNSISTDIINNIVFSGDNNYTYYVARNGDEALAWTGVKWGENIGRLEGITTSPATRKSKENRFANYALQWFIIEEAIRRNVKGLDYAGVEPDSSDPKLINIMKFKLSWGGDVVEYDTYSKDLNMFKIGIVKSLRAVQRLLRFLISHPVLKTVKSLFQKKINNP